MTSEETYQRLLFKINKNNTQGNIKCDRFQAVVIINEAKNRWVEKHLKDKDSILIDSLQEIIKTAFLDSPEVKSNYVEFELEEDFYEDILAKSNSVKGKCKGTVYSREVKNQNKNILEWDENQRPDFDWEWTFHTVQENKLRIYKSDFEIKSAEFEYYSRIPDFDVEGYINLSGNNSTNKPFTLSDQYVDQILNITAEEFARNNSDQVNLQIAKDRTANEE